MSAYNSDAMADAMTAVRVEVGQARAENERLIEAGEALAQALHYQSTARPKPAPCVPHIRNDGRPDCPNCEALARWEAAVASSRKHRPEGESTHA